MIPDENGCRYLPSVAVGRAVREVHWVAGTEQGSAMRTGHDYFIGLNGTRQCVHSSLVKTGAPMVAITTHRSVRSLGLITVLCFFLVYFFWLNFLWAPFFL